MGNNFFPPKGCQKLYLDYLVIYLRQFASGETLTIVFYHRWHILKEYPALARSSLGQLTE